MSWTCIALVVVVALVVIVVAFVIGHMDGGRILACFRGRINHVEVVIHQLGIVVVVVSQLVVFFGDEPVGLLHIPIGTIFLLIT